MTEEERKELRKISETMDGLIMPMIPYLESVTAKRVSEGLRIIREVYVEQPKTGHWIVKEGREQGYDIAGIKTWYIQIMCDKCGFIKTAIEGHTGQYHFCPNCGAKMESEKF